MADAKISALTEDTSPASNDLVVTVDVSDTTQAGSGTTKKVTISNFQSALSITESQISDLDHSVDVVSNVATSRILGRTTAGSGDSEELTATQVRSLINVEDGADVTDTTNVTAAGALMDSEVDADIKTLSLPANTTISTFGASLVDDANAAAARTTLGVDAAGTDNSTDVTLAGTPNYLTLSGQEITLTKLDITDDTNATAGDGISISTNTFALDINGLTEEAGFTSGDFLAFYDTTAGALRKVDYDDLPGGGSNEFADNVFRIQDNGDATKEIAFEASGITTATTRTLTVPDADLTIVGTATSQTLTNKTIDADNNTISNLALAAEVTGALTDLSNVDTDKSKTPADGDVLTFDGTDWNAEAPSGGGISDGDKGDITVSSSGSVWTLDDTAIQGKTTTAPNNSDNLLFSDASDSNNLKKATVDSIVGATGSDVLGLTSLEYQTGPVVVGRVTGTPGTLSALSPSDVRDVASLNTTDDVTFNSITIGSSNPFSDSSGTLTLQNVDALDATTESTIEAAIDTLSNLTSVGTIGTGTWEATDIAVAHGGTGASTAADARTNLGLGTTDDVHFQDVQYQTATGDVDALGNLGATETINWDNATHFTGTLDSNVTITHSNETTGRKITLFLDYDGSAQRTITWSDVDKWLGGSAPDAPSASGETLVVTLSFIGTTCYGSAEIAS